MLVLVSGLLLFFFGKRFAVLNDHKNAHTVCYPNLLYVIAIYVTIIIVKRFFFFFWFFIVKRFEYKSIGKFNLI